MSEAIIAIYRQGVLRPLKPLHLPENSRVKIQIISQDRDVHAESERARAVLREAGIIGPRPESNVLPVDEEELLAAAEALGAVGPLSELVLRERDGR